MRKLTDQQRRFAEAYARNGGNGRAAAQAAGYSPTNVDAAKATAYTLLRKERVVEEIVKVSKQLFVSDVPRARNVFLQLMEDENQAGTLRFKCAEKIADLGGMKVAAKVEHEHKEVDTRTDDEIRAKIVALQKQLGEDDVDAVH